MASPVCLKNGEQLHINDHVYCSPKWQLRDGTPYSIARIMAFLPPEDMASGDSGRPNHYTRVRLAWYYRPTDVSDRPIADSRLLLAAIYSEVTDINQIRGKCYVVHRDKISDLAGWKRRPDRFYFNRLFDPYIKKEFEVIQSTDVRNLPDRIRDVLLSRFEYVVAEKEVIPDLTDNIRLCDACQEWCPSQDSVQCDRCKRFFHMLCVQPPLAAKPSRGYGWTCAPCSRRHEEEVDSKDLKSNGQGGQKPRSNAPAARARGRPRKDRVQADKESNLPIKHFKMWPFRYFGQYTVAEDTLHPDDFLWPKTATRHGPKYQASVPNTPELTMQANKPSEEYERGTDNTIEVLGCMDILTDSEVAELERCMDALTTDEDLKTNVEWLTEAVARFSDAALHAKPFSEVTMKDMTRSPRWGKPTPLLDREWSREEIAAFEDAINNHGAELRAVRDEVGNRTMPEVVRFYGLWKCSKLGLENKRIREQGSTSSKPSSRRHNVTIDSKSGQKIGHDGEGSIIAAPSKSSVCGACRTKDSKVWWKAPKGVSSSVLCDTCGTNWRKYADLNVRPVREESVPVNKPRLEKREGTPLLDGPKTKRTKVSTSNQPSPPPGPSVPLLRCMACNKNGPVGKVIKCRSCQFRCHAGSCGAIVDPSTYESWICDLCQNEETLEASVYPHCLLCPRASPMPIIKHYKSSANGNIAFTSNTASDSFLRACKPTEGSGWAHILCSVFIPETTFTDTKQFKQVESLNIVARHRWQSVCNICQQQEGAVIKCGECPKEYHVSCAWKHGHRFGFEIQPVKSSRRDTMKTVAFRGENGSMNPVVVCKEHNIVQRDIYAICQVNESGETALQVYAQAYKQAPIIQGHGLLRKAQRLDGILNIRSTSAQSEESSASDEDQICNSCSTEFSPQFYPITVHGTPTWLCHRCYTDQHGVQSSDSIGDPYSVSEAEVKSDYEDSISGVNSTSNVNGINGMEHNGTSEHDSEMSVDDSESNGVQPATSSINDLTIST